MHNSKQLSTLVPRNMSELQSNQPLLVLVPIDLSLSLSLISSTSTSTSNDMSFNTTCKKRMICDQDDQETAKRLKSFSVYTMEEEAEERLNGVCTKLKLFSDPWKIKKVLEKSDANGLCRLMISKRLVQQHVVKEWERAGRFEELRRIDERNGVSVRVWDCDRREEFVLTLRKHSRSSDCYVFNTNWSSQFVNKRGLKKGDEIGLFWCNFSECFFFSVLAFAPNQP